MSQETAAQPMHLVSNEPDVLKVNKGRAFEAYHAMFRASRQFMTSNLVNRMLKKYDAYLEQNPSSSYDSTEQFADDLPEFQVFAWATRHFLRMRFYTDELGVIDTVEAQRQQLLSELDEVSKEGGEYLRLNPAMTMPSYYTNVDYHQLAGGVWSDDLAGLIYETGRSVALLSDSSEFNIYKWSYDQVPEGQYKRVLDWGTGAGAGILEWQRQHTQSECYGVDLAAPCLTVAHKRANERGYKIRFSQQDLTELDFEDDYFDLVVHMFMFHELPVSRIPKMMRELYRVLKPGGLFCGPEIRLTPDHNFLNVLQRNQAICTDEIYSGPWHEFDLESAAYEAGFSEVRVEPLKAVLTANKGKNALSSNHFEYYTLIK